MSAAAVEVGGLLGVYVEGAAGRDLDAVAARLRDALGLDPVLLRVAAIEKLPRSSAGKVLYSVLERRPLSE
jgi:acyl-CoA synthetase (AMP-forming)/AMP-acid ligase II